MGQSSHLLYLSVYMTGTVQILMGHAVENAALNWSITVRVVVKRCNKACRRVRLNCLERGKLGGLLSAGFILFLFRGLCVFSYSSDLRTMTERLKSGYFSSKKLFIADMMRIFTNCRTYNAPETEYYKCANTVERFFLSKVKELRKT